MRKQIEALNQRQLSSKKPVIDKEKIHYEWEDTSLLPMLCKGIPQIYPRHVSKENQKSEEEAVRLANELITDVNQTLNYSKLENSFDALIASSDGYIGSRLESIKYAVTKDARARKGLLIYGEGGIGKTYFLYELAQELSSKNASYAIAFNQEGIIMLSELDLPSMMMSASGSFTLIIDACNELDESAFEHALNLIRKTLKADHANVVVATRSGSPTARMEDLQSLLPTSLEFQGVNPDLVFSALAESADEIIVQFQDMLFSKNPRNLNAMLAMIRSFRSSKDGLNATAQRTSLVESCIKSSLSKHQWTQTKKLCEFLLDTEAIGLSKKDTESVLGKEADVYLSSMMEQGFLECHDYGGGELRYYYSSESQIRYVIARCLHSDLDKLNSRALDENGLIDGIAKLIYRKSYSASDHELIQVSIDRYLNRGPRFIAKLLDKLEQYGLMPEWEKIFSQTIFPLDWDFKDFANICKVEPGWAFLHFGGILNTPLNLTNYANDIFLADSTLVDRFFIEHWERWSLTLIISRIQNISDFVSHTNRVPAAAVHEWVWFSIWCSFSSNMRLRALSQRLMFFLCDSSDDALREVIGAWRRVQDVFARRAIAKTISCLDKETKSSADVRRFVESIVGDESISDSIIIASICHATQDEVTPIDFSTRNIYRELEGSQPTEKDTESFMHQADYIDLIHKNFFPFDVYQMKRGYLDFHYHGNFILSPLEAVASWNDSLRNLLNCQTGGECDGQIMQVEDFQELLPVKFETEHLDQRRLLDCVVLLTKLWLERYGGNLQDLLGEFRPLNPYHEAEATPNMKPFCLASHELLGSLASNYFVDEIALGKTGSKSCGFRQYEDQAYNEPGTIHTCTPSSNFITESAKLKIERKIVSPETKEDLWFDDALGAFGEILDLLKPIKARNAYWQPIAFSARKRIYEGSKLMRSNEFIVSIAFNTGRHLDSCREYRHLTIEHETFTGNIKDYGREEGDLCLIIDPPDERCTISERNQILLPPPSLIRKLNLVFSPRDACFTDEKSGDVIIACDGAPGNYYREPVHNLILIRSDKYEELLQSENIAFFAFSERYSEKTGYSNDCDRHWEFRADGTMVASYPNNGNIRPPTTPEHCKDCYFSSEQRKTRRNDRDLEFEEPDWLKEMRSKRKGSCN
ncbi:MAG: hypothetical protein UCH28_01050 [Adlercreutzia sp.]|nr:hypothetical protein [Adlercreutzia sp.]